MINTILENLKQDIDAIIKKLGVNEPVEVIFEIPKDVTNGDYSTNISMRLAKTLRKSPIAIANEIVKEINLEKNHLAKCEIAGAGFINFYLDLNFLAKVIFKINDLKNDYGNLQLGNEKINLEFVSANPTGYLHIGHGRGAAYGDSLARILKKAGFEVSKEHYVNDAGNQINNLANSIFERYKELFGLESNLPDGYYHGKEIITIAKLIRDQFGAKYLHEEWFITFRQFGVEYLLEGLKKDLKDFNVTFDTWFSEKSLYDNGEVNKTLQFLIDHNYTYELDGAIWLRTSDFKDEKDRVLVKSDKTLTYLTPDIAYHANKLSRGYDRLIDVLGADHHGYIDRLKAAIACIGGNPDKVDVEILQMVRVLQDGEELKMSKRSGKAITLRDLIDEIGTDALRFMYISKSLSTHMDLDLDLAIKQSNDNPVYYAQYAYARIFSIFKMVQTNGLQFHEVNAFHKINIEKCDKIIKTLLQYPLVIEEAAQKRIPHKIAQYILTLATAFHSYYNDEKIITDDIEETNEKLTLLRAVQIVLKNSLDLIGVGIKEKM
jgi:arginyl-tRNA synthetase